MMLPPSRLGAAAHTSKTKAAHNSTQESAPVRPRDRVVYLFGAGASHACVAAANSSYSILMKDLREELAERLKATVQTRRGGVDKVGHLLNMLTDERTDFEHVITFLEESSSALHQEFAADMRIVFEEVLRRRLKLVEEEQKRTPDDLYYALLDMHDIPALPEELTGFLTLNYDHFLEHAIERSPSRDLDVGVFLRPPTPSPKNVKVLKLHGSFTWGGTWPITEYAGDLGTQWIPPGIQKVKGRYPFNLLWGLARELLDCDILRIVGCRLAANDWDLVSLLFSTRLTNASDNHYRIEIIDAPKHAKRLQAAYPYLNVQSLLEIEPLGSQLIGEITNDRPRAYASLDPDERKEIVERAGISENWFRRWLKLKAEATLVDLGSVDTADGAFRRLLEEPA